MSANPQKKSRPSVQGFTIDGETSRDLDDAIWAEALPLAGGCRLTISIADVAKTIARGDLLDKDAARRVETRYQRNGNIPMLPRHLSEDELSLFEGRPRDVLAIIITVAPDGTPGQVVLKEARLVSAARFSHEATDQVLRGEDHPLREQLRLCQQVAQVLLARRQASGACALYDPRRGLYADEDGVIRHLSGSAHAQIIVQEFMILANECVATWMAKAGGRLLFRNHQARPSSPERSEVIRQLNEALLHPNLLPALQERMTLWMERATYGPTLLGHFALNLPAYTHITSPIRRYADLVNHRLIKAALRGDPEPYGREELEEIASGINAWREAQAEATKEHFKGAAVQDRRKTLASSVTALESLDGPSFGRALEQAVKDDTPAPALLQVMGSRELAPMDLYYLFFRGGAGWDPARQTALGRLRQQPHQAIMVLEIAQQKDQATLESEVLPFKGQFLALQRVIYAGKHLACPSATLAATKKAAQALAAVAWLEGRVNGTLVPADQVVLRPPEPEPGIPPTEEPVDDRNYVGLLNEWCQQRKSLAPTYVFQSDGTPHQPSFKATVSLRFKGQVLEADGAPAASKQDAKRNAAFAMHGRLPG